MNRGGKKSGKGKGERERYTQLNTEFWRIARRGKKAFLNEQCKEIEGNNKMGKTRALFKKSRDIKGTFHGRMVTIKDRNSKELTEAEEIKRWQEYTKKGLFNNLDNHGGIVTHLEPDILECKVKWALGNITTNKASGQEE